MGDSMAKSKPTLDIVIKNTFINDNKETKKTELNRKIEKIIQKTGK